MDRKKEDFLEILFGYYDLLARDLPWRQNSHVADPYKIMVSEIMLQQTQVNRVIPKYESFLKVFPNVASLANAKLADVLVLWSGLGYNRRAKFLWQAAQQIQNECAGNFPRTIQELIKLPGIGKNTAGAIVAYAFNQKIVFIETNIRTVLLHHFFAAKSKVSDRELEAVLTKIIKTIDDPRNFYWAMMDYGSFLKKSGNNSIKSSHYTKQTTFKGSKRQIRGLVIKLLSTKPHSKKMLQEHVLDQRLEEVLKDLAAEGLITKNSSHYSLG